MQTYLIFASVSGGLDSFTSVMHVIDELLQRIRGSAEVKVYLTNFDYQQKHSIEFYFASIQYKILQKLFSKALKFNARNIKISFDFEQFDISFLGQISKKVSALVKDSSIDNPEEYLDTIEPLSVVPNRNFIFANILLAKALAIAQQIQPADNIKGYLVFGIHKSPYLDTKPEFKAIMQQQADLLTAKHYEHIETPFKALDLKIQIPFLCGTKEDVAREFIRLTKKYQFNWLEIFEVLEELYESTRDEMYKIIHHWLMEEITDFKTDNRFELITYSCYNGKFPECGYCATCKEKREAFKKTRAELN